MGPNRARSQARLYTLSRYIFLLKQKVIKELGYMEGVCVGGRNVNCIIYANDFVLIADSNEKLQEITTSRDEVKESRN